VKPPASFRVTVKSAGGAGTQCRSTGCRVCRVNVHTGGTHTGHTGAQGHTVKLTVQFSTGRPRRRSSAQLRPRTTTCTKLKPSSTRTAFKNTGGSRYTPDETLGRNQPVLFASYCSKHRGHRFGGAGHTRHRPALGIYTCRWGRDVVLPPACALVGCAGRPIAQGGPPAALSTCMDGVVGRAKIYVQHFPTPLHSPLQTRNLDV